MSSAQVQAKGKVQAKLRDIPELRSGKGRALSPLSLNFAFRLNLNKVQTKGPVQLKGEVFKSTLLPFA